MTAYIVSGGQTSSGITLNNGDTLTVLSGGTAIATTVKSGGSETVSSGGTSSNTTVFNGGMLGISGTDIGTVVSGGGGPGGFGLETVYSGGATSGATIHGGALQVLSGGMASGTVLVDSGGVAEFGGPVGNGATIALVAGSLQIDDLIDHGTGVQEFNAPISGLSQVSAGGDSILLNNAFNERGTIGPFDRIDGAAPGVFNSATNTTPLGLTFSGTTVATLTLDGNYAGRIFIAAENPISNKFDASVEIELFPPPLFGAPQLASPSFGASAAAGGWTSQNVYPRLLADVNGDGVADIVGFGAAGIYVSLNTGGGNFAPPFLGVANFGASSTAGGWTSQDAYPRELADVNGDKMADIVGFGTAGIYVSLAVGGGNFAAPTLALNAFGGAGGWTSQNLYPRETADVNGDGKADIVAFGANGVYVSDNLGNGQFSQPVLALNAFGQAQGWTSQDQYPREWADVTGDGLPDIVGFGSAGVWVAVNLGNGQFAQPVLELNAFGAVSGWTSQNIEPRELADVNGDGKADIVGFGASGPFVSLATGNGGFAQPVGVFNFNGLAFGYDPLAGGWSTQNAYPRELADITGDKKTDIVGFGANGVYVSPSLEPTPMGTNLT